MRGGAFFLVCCFASLASATEGAMLLGSDTIHLGHAGAGVASPQTAYWTLLNPAGLVSLERRVDFSLCLLTGSATLEGRGLAANPLGRDLSFSREVALPAIGMVWPLTPDTALGLGFYAPSGTRIDYEESRNLVTSLFEGHRDRRLKFDQSRLILACGHRFDNGWALGVAVHAGINRINTDHVTLGLKTAAANMDRDLSASLGFGLGVYRYWERISIGFGYVSRQWSQSLHKYDDLVLGTADLPHILQAGVAWRPVRPLEILLDYRFIQWSGVRQFGDDVLAGGFHWRDQHILKAALEWDLDPKLTLRCGISHGHSPIREESVFLSALTPVTTETNVSVGFTAALSDAWECHGAFVHAVPNTLVDGGRGNPISLFAKGTRVSNRSDGLVLGVTWKF